MRTSALLLLITPLLTSACLYPRSENSTASNPHPNWGYHGVTGPLLWHTLSPEYSACSTGQHQSPINLTPQSTITIPGNSSESVHQNYPHAADFACTNNGHTINCVPESTAIKNDLKLSALGKDWKVENFHWHVPSEHLVDGHQAVAELHWVHSRVGEHGKTENTVVGIRFVAEKVQRELLRTRIGDNRHRGRIDIGRKNGFVETFVKEVVEKVGEIGKEAELKGVDLSDVMEFTKGADVLHYEGSLTTPPCSEGIKWLVIKKSMVLDVEEFNKLAVVLGFNARYVQNPPGERNLLKEVEAHAPKRRMR